MTREERLAFEEFVGMMTVVGEEYGKTFSEAAILVRWEAIRKYGIEKIRAAISTHLQTCKFYPKISDLIDLIEGRGVREIEDRASLAWGEFIAGMESVGGYYSVRFLDRIINEIVLEWGGWEKVCSLTYDELRFKRKEFVELYRAIARRGRRGLPDRCIGMIEGHNRTREEWEKHIPPAKVVGRIGGTIEIQDDGERKRLQDGNKVEGGEELEEISIEKLIERIGSEGKEE